QWPRGVTLRCANCRCQRPAVRGRNPTLRQLTIELLDARRDDVHELVDFPAGDAERRSQSDDRVSSVHDGPALPGLAVELGHLGPIQRSPGAIRVGELDTHHEPAAAYLADDPFLPDRV